MNKLVKDLKGQRFGKLVPLKLLNRRCKNGGVYWLCQCDCGDKIEVAATTLISGRSKSCGKHPTKKAHCIRGHDMAAVGRTPGGSCRLCGRAKRWQSEYGMSEADYRALWDFQKGKCAICETVLNDTIGQQGFGRGARVEIDHDHAKNLPSKRASVRGLLCGGRWAGCNRRLGNHKTEWLEKAVSYLRSNPAQQCFQQGGSIGKT